MTFRYANLQEAKMVAIFWNGNPDSVVHLENFSSSVYKFNSSLGQPQILRFIDCNQRTYEQVLGELEFLEYLKSKSVRCCYPIMSSDGLLAKPFQSTSGMQTCSSFNFVNGIEVNETSPYWNKHLFRVWGRNLATIFGKNFTISNLIILHSLCPKALPGLLETLIPATNNSANSTTSNH